MPAGGPAAGAGGAEGGTRLCSESPLSDAKHLTGVPRRSKKNSRQIRGDLNVKSESSCRLVMLLCVFSGKRGLDERLSTTQILLQQQEEAVRRGDRERRALVDRVKDLERSLQASETDKKHTQVHARLCNVCTRLNSMYLYY